MSVFGDIFKAIFPVVLNGAKAVADSYVKGDELSLDQKKILWNAYNIAKTAPIHIVESSENEYDDQALDALVELMEDTLTEAGLPIPEIPEELTAIEATETE